jgi:hypothetical protein
MHRMGIMALLAVRAPRSRSQATRSTRMESIRRRPRVASGSEFGCARLPVPGQKLVKVLDGVIGDAGEHIGEPSLWIDVVEFRCLCRAPNYAEWLRNDALSRRICGSVERASSGSTRHSLVAHSASRKASRRSLGRKGVRLACSYGFSFARAASLSARWACR